MAGETALEREYPNENEVDRERRRGSATPSSSESGRGRGEAAATAAEMKAERWRNLQTWAAVVIIGLAISGTSYVITLLMALLLEAKLAIAAAILVDNGDGRDFGWVVLTAIAWCSLAVVLVFLAFGMVLFIAPLGAGSGLPETKGFLNGTKVKGLFSPRTLIVRALGVVLVVSATLPVGREQPLIHIGAAVSFIVMHLSPVWRLVIQKSVTEDAREQSERVYATIGAAAGISSAYGAPVGGVLYVFEELATFWDEKTTLKCFVCCLLAAALVSWIKIGGFLGESFAGLVIFENGNNTLELGDWSLAEVPFFVILGLLGGLSSSIFTWIGLRLTHFRRSMRQRYGNWWQVIDLLVMVVTINLLYVMLPASFGCDMNPEYESSGVGGYRKSSLRRSLFAAESGDHHRQFYQYNCGDGYYNKLASLLLTGEEGALKHLFARDVDVFGPTCLVVFFCVYYLSAAGVVGLQIPMGHFVPNMLSGAALGRLYGKLLKTWLKGTDIDISPGIYAQIGSAAQLSGFTRMTIALAVLLTEASGDVSLMIPMMIAMLFARGLAGFLLLPMDEVLMEIKKIVFLGSKPPRSLQGLLARDVMHTDFSTLNALCGVEEAGEAVNDTRAQQVRFPVVGKACSGPNGECGGQDAAGAGAGADGEKCMIGVIARSRLRDRLKGIQMDNSLALREEDRVSTIDLTDGSIVLDRQALSVSPDLTMPQVFHIFRKFGIRQMFVVGRANAEQVAAVQGAGCHVLGMISRKDLVDPDHLRRANNAYGTGTGGSAIVPRPDRGLGDDDDDDHDDDDDDEEGLVHVTIGSARKGATDGASSSAYKLSAGHPMLQRISSSSDTIDDSIDDELVEGDSSDTVVAQERLSMRPHRSVADLLQTIKENATPSNSLRRENGVCMESPLVDETRGREDMVDGVASDASDECKDVRPLEDRIDDDDDTESKDQVSENDAHDSEAEEKDWTPADDADGLLEAGRDAASFPAADADRSPAGATHAGRRSDETGQRDALSDADDDVGADAEVQEGDQ